MPSILQCCILPKLTAAMVKHGRAESSEIISHFLFSFQSIKASGSLGGKGEALKSSHPNLAPANASPDNRLETQSTKSSQFIGSPELKFFVACAF